MPRYRNVIAELALVLTVIGSLLALGLLALGCEGCRERTRTDSALLSELPRGPVKDSERLPSVSLLKELGFCSVSYKGALMDLGNEFADVRRSFSVGPFDDVRNVVRGSKTYAAALARELSYGFWLQQESTSLSVALRARAGVAERVNVYLDDERLGVVRLPLSDFDTLLSPESRRPLRAGHHTVMLRFEARRRTEPDAPLAELDWLWVGDKGDMAENYAPPTLDDIVADVALAGEPRRSLVLRAPATVRCVVRPARAETLEMALGFWGQGQGTAQLRAVAEGEAPVMLAEHSLQGGDQAVWKPISVDLSRFEGKLVAVELHTVRIQGSGRIAFGEPVIQSGARPTKDLPDAQNVIVVLAGGLSRSALPPWGPTQGFRGLSQLVHEGVTFNGYRTRSTVVTAVVASLLTGLAPHLHAVEDTSYKLPSSLVTIAETLKQHEGHSALFTGVPSSFAAFGFDRGWDRFRAISPIEDQPATQPLSEGADWLLQEIEQAPKQKHLLIVHSRGGHPPWDLSREETASLPPEEYAGMLEARRGGIILAELRTLPLNSRRRLRAEDWTRLRAMQDLTLKKQDQELARLIDTLRQKGQWERTLFVYAADVSMGDAPDVPFGAAALSEDRLLAPLIVKFPGPPQSGKQIVSACTTEDITRTISDALGLPVGEQIMGENLQRVMSGWEPPGGSPQIAVLGNQFSTRWGQWMLLGEFGAVPRLCQLEVDPSCVRDVFDNNPTTVSALWGATFQALRQEPRAKRQAVSLDDFTKDALTVWGE